MRMYGSKISVFLLLRSISMRSSPIIDSVYYAHKYPNSYFSCSARENSSKPDQLYSKKDIDPNLTSGTTEQAIVCSCVSCPEKRRCSLLSRLLRLPEQSGPRWGPESKSCGFIGLPKGWGGIGGSEEAVVCILLTAKKIGICIWAAKSWNTSFQLIRVTLEDKMRWWITSERRLTGRWLSEGRCSRGASE